MSLQNTIEDLKKQKDSKLAEAAQFDQAIKELERLIMVVEPGHIPASSEYAGLGIRDAAKRLLTEVGGPLATRELAEGVLKRGLETGSKNFTATMYTVLSTAPDIRRTADGRWELGAPDKARPKAGKPVAQIDPKHKGGRLVGKASGKGAH